MAKRPTKCELELEVATKRILALEDELLLAKEEIVKCELELAATNSRVLALENELLIAKEEIVKLTAIIAATPVIPNPPPQVAQSLHPTVITIDETESGVISPITFLGGLPDSYTNPQLGGTDAGLFSIAMVSDTQAELTLTSPNVPDILNITVTVDNDAGTSAALPVVIVVNETGTAEPAGAELHFGPWPTEVTNFPVMSDYPFRDGDIPNAPVAQINGVTVDTQSQTISTHPSGDVYLCKLAFVIPSIPANTVVTVKFVDGATVAGSAPSFPAVTASIGGRRDATTTTKPVQAMLDTGHYETIFSGPIVEIRDCWDPVTKAYDFTTVGDSIKPIRPRFDVTAWFGDVNLLKVHNHFLATDNMQLRDEVVDELISIIGDETYSYTKAPRILAHGTRAQHTAWIGTAPPEIPIDWDLDYIKSTGFLPNYITDASVVGLATESWIAERYAAWQAADKGFNDRGLYPTSLPASWEGQIDLGDQVAALATGDPRLREMAIGHARLWCYRNFMHEGQSGRFFDKAQTIPALGLPVSIYARKRERIYEDAYFELAVHNESFSLGSGNVSVTSGSPVVTVNNVTHRFTTGQRANITGVSAVGGITPNISNVTITRISDTSFSYTFTSNATSNATGGGASGVATRRIRIADVMSAWQAAHDTNPFRIPALMTGEHSWTWLAQTKACTTPLIESVFQGVGIPNSYNSCRRWLADAPLAIAGFSNETRGIAWELLSRWSGYILSPSGSAMRAHCLQLLVDQLCYEAGRLGVSLPEYATEPAYLAGVTAQQYGSGPTTCEYSPIGWYPEITSDNVSAQNFWDTPNTVKAIQPRQHNYIVQVLGLIVASGLTGFQPLLDVWGTPVKSLLEACVAGDLDALMIAAGKTAEDAPKLLSLYQAAMTDSTATPTTHTGWVGSVTSLTNAEIVNRVNQFDSGTSTYPMTGGDAAAVMLTEASDEWQLVDTVLLGNVNLQNKQFMSNVRGWPCKPRT